MPVHDRGILTSDWTANHTPRTRRSAGSQSPARDLLARAGIRSGCRILDLGARLYDREMFPHELQEFRVLGLDEDATGDIPPRLWPVGHTASFRFTVPNVSEVELPGESFDAVVAVDWWPSTPLGAAVSHWRRLLEPERGVAVVVGTDVRTPESRSGALREWTDELTAAGFRLETARDEQDMSERYAGLVDDVRSASDRLRKVIGASSAASYLTHVELLDRAARYGLTHRFEIVARL